jgi:hypothetical protein
MEKMMNRELQKKPDNWYHTQFPRNSEVSTAVPCRLGVKVFTEKETKGIVQACKRNNCSVTGAIAAAARGALHSKKAYGIFGFLKIRGFFSGFSGFSPDFLADF